MKKLGNATVKCFYCGQLTHYPVRGRKATRAVIKKQNRDPLLSTEDHLIPVSRNGNGHPDNIMLSCRACNIGAGISAWAHRRHRCVGVPWRSRTAGGE